MQMITKEQVEDFLKKLKEKIKVFDIVFRDDRGKNLQTLAALEIAPTFMLGQPNSSTICISFHISEHPMNYPFKN